MSVIRVQEDQQATYRRVLGQYPTGVAVVTSIGATGEPLGMTVGSFGSVSLDPPLVAFMPDQGSSSWRALREAGNTFCVNILSAQQESVCRAVATRKSDKFSDIAWRRSPHGLPVIEGAVAYIDCTIEAIHAAGDHHIVIGRVDALDVVNPSNPLLFFRGGYGSFVPTSLASGDRDLLEQLALVDEARPLLDRLAHDFDSEVTVTIRMHDELILAAASGRLRHEITPRQVGQRARFRPPLGSVNAAWGDPGLRERWLDNLGPDTSGEDRAEHLAVAERVRRRGTALSFGPPIAAGGREVEGLYNPVTGLDETSEPLRSVSGPVFSSDGEVAFTITLWVQEPSPGPGAQQRRTAHEHVEAVRDTCRRATEAIGGVSPPADPGSAEPTDREGR